MHLKKNIGKIDRYIRLLLGIIILYAAGKSRNIISGLIGIFTIFEAASGWCVFYQLIGKNTCPMPGSIEYKKLKNLSSVITGVGILFVVYYLFSLL